MYFRYQNYTLIELVIKIFVSQKKGIKVIYRKALDIMNVGHLIS
jgi:hypothetical protein